MRWRSLVGGAWSTGVSFHGPIGPAKIAPADDPIVHGAVRFSINDEIDERPSLEPGVRVLASAPERGEAPVFRVQERDSSRSAYCTLGHTPQGCDSNGLRALIGATPPSLMRERDAVLA